MSLGGVFCGLGMFLFGYTMAIGANAIVCAFLQGVMMVGVLIGIFATLAYGLDAFRNQSNEIFIMNMLFKVPTPLSPFSHSPLPSPQVQKEKTNENRISCSTAYPTSPTIGLPLKALRKSCMCLEERQFSCLCWRSRFISMGRR